MACGGRGRQAELSTLEEAAAAEAGGVVMSMAAPVTATELPGEYTNVSTKKSRKRSRIHEVFEEEATDKNYSICQCLKSEGGDVCGARIKCATGSSALRTHVEKKHPSMWARLRDWRRTVRMTLRQLKRGWHRMLSLRSVSRISR